MSETVKTEVRGRILIIRLEREEKRNRPQVKGADANYRSGNRVLADLLGGIFGGLVIGWAIDRFAGTATCVSARRREPARSSHACQL